MNVLSLDLNPYASRAVLVDSAGNTLEHHECPPNRCSTSWMRELLEERPAQHVVGSPLDKWPLGLSDTIRVMQGQLHWLDPSMMRRLYSICRPWNLHRKLHRARLLAYLYHHEVSYWQAEQAVRNFEILTAEQLLQSK